MDVFLFLIFAAIAVVCGYQCGGADASDFERLSLIGVMGSLAVLYLLLGAEFIAAAQVIVYAGAIMVLFVFVIMLLNAGAEAAKAGRCWRRCWGFRCCSAFLGLMAYFVQRTCCPVRRMCDFGGFQHGTAQDVGRALFTNYLLPFEVVFGADPDRHSRRDRAGAKGDGVTCPAGVPLSWYLILSAILFTLGIAGFMFRRNIITVFMSIELMLNAVNLSFITFSYQLKQVNGHIFSFFVMVVAAAEAAVGLAIILTVFKNRSTLEYR